MDSKVSTSIIDKTPLIGQMVDDTYKAVKDIYSLKEKYETNDNKDEYNKEILKIMLDKKVITKSMVQELIDSKKLDFKGVQELLNNYEEVKND